MLGISTVAIACSALKLPLALPGGLLELEPFLKQVAARLQIELAQLHVVGSARFGFSLRDGALFDPRFSDLDLAVINPKLYSRCEVTNGQLSSGPRFPELELPAAEGMAFRRMFDDLSRLTIEQFAYVSIAVYPDFETLVNTEASRIHAYFNLNVEAANQEPTSLAESFGRNTFDAAVGAGLPCFLGLVNESPPGKASPYLIDEVGFRQAYGTSPTRQRLLDALNQAFLDLQDVVQVACCLVGGSFIELGRPDPHDLDIAIFYRALEQPGYEPGRALLRLSRKFLLRGIDAHFIPCDVEPWLPIKMASFYTSLFQADRTEPGHRRGLALLVPNVFYCGKQTSDAHDQPVQAETISTV